MCTQVYNVFSETECTMFAVSVCSACANLEMFKLCKTMISINIPAYVYVLVHRIETAGFSAVPLTNNGVTLVAVGYTLAPKGNQFL